MRSLGSLKSKQVSKYMTYGVEVKNRITFFSQLTVLGWRSFVRSLLRAGVQPTLDPSAETFMSVQCASPGRRGQLVGVCGVCASCVGWRKG